jgi:predicted nucleic acid-binding protein
VYLVDTNVISAASPGRALGSADFRTWMEEHSDRLYLSATSVAEIEAGIAKARRARATRKARDLRDWLEGLLHLYGDRVLAFDTECARIAGALSDRALAQGHSPGFADITIAATAKRHDLILLTRNLRHFAPLGVAAIDPFQTLPRRPRK